MTTTDTTYSSLRNILAWHLTSNHYPPVPVSLVEPCIYAIELAAEGDGDALVGLPDDLLYKGSDAAPAWALVEHLHLDPFIQDLQHQEDDD